MDHDDRDHSDVVVVGAGIVGLGVADAAHRRGLSVTVLDRSPAATGATVRNFGHVCLTPQTGRAWEYARAARERWIRLGHDAGFAVRQDGTWVVARHPDEVALLAAAAERAPDATPVHLLDAGEFTARAAVAGAVGGAHLPADLQVDPRRAAAALAAHLERRGVRFRWRTPALGVEEGRVVTGRGTLTAGLVVVAVNHDLDHLLPGLAEAAGVQRCALDMLRVDAGLPAPLPGPLLTGWSLVRYRAFADLPEAVAVRERLHAEHPRAAAFDVNLMATQQPDGSLLLGDTHRRGPGVDPFQSEEANEVLLACAADLFGVPRPRVLERWQGVYASGPEEFLVARPAPGVVVATVTTGIGMTTGLGLAEDVVRSAVGGDRP
ncbi:TIGR03364 family FAD-dependent oxidoreductase [Kineococcus sp. NPDC059986]|uniref:TIGR03364 family FAD-dependent oxidoreductase n=1 Tax=Kineococcus sp. NPDC059986 TaxID=3155538 RepID=UPI00344D19B1